MMAKASLWRKPQACVRTVLPAAKVPLSSVTRQLSALQGEWSNNAYNLQTGYPNRSGQKGCLDGH
jgi:hypothetical protein